MDRLSIWLCLSLANLKTQQGSKNWYIGLPDIVFTVNSKVGSNFRPSFQHALLQRMMFKMPNSLVLLQKQHAISSLISLDQTLQNSCRSTLMFFLSYLSKIETIIWSMFRFLSETSEMLTTASRTYKKSILILTNRNQDSHTDFLFMTLFLALKTLMATPKATDPLL